MNRLPDSVISILETVRDSTLTPDDIELELWNYPDHHKWVDIFMEFGIELFDSDIDAEGLPLGYILVGFIFDWEAQNQWDGWLALSNRSEYIDAICESYKAVGLEKESNAIHKAYLVWDEEKNNQVEAGKAYASENPEYPNDLERMEYIARFLADNKDALFYEQTT